MVVIDTDDVGKSREELLMDLIYESSGIRIPLDKIKFGVPQEVDPRKDLDYDTNTFIPVDIDPQYDDRFGLSTGGVMYRRRNLKDYVKDINPSKITPLFLPFKISDVLDQINALVPYGFQIEELIDHEYKTLEEVKEGIKIEAAKGAYIWFDSVKTRVNTIFLAGVPLITNTKLNGFLAFGA